MTRQNVFEKLRGKAVPIGFVLAILVAGIVFNEQLRAWFTGQAGKGAQSDALTATAGRLALRTSLQPDTPREKGNEVQFVLEDSDGKPVSGASIKASIWMPAMGSMPEMRTKAAVSEGKAGRYSGGFDLAMGGTWTMDVEVEAGSDKLTASFTLTVGTSGLVQVGSGGGGGAPALHHAFGEVCRKELAKALEAYELLRAELAADRTNGLAKPGAKLVDALRAARLAEDGAPEEIKKHFEAGTKAAIELQKATTLETARARFADVSEHIVALTAADPVTRKDLHLFECGMTKGYNKWLQPEANLANPYQGSKMLTCGSELQWKAETPDPHAGHAHGGGEIDHYTCPMDTWVKQKKAGKCPVCGMDLVGVTKEEMKTGVMRIDHRRRQLIGLRLAKMATRPLTLEVDAVGKVAYDETRLADVTLKYDGFIHRLLVNKTGQRVRRGQTLFTLYSPQLYNAQQEYLLALAQRGIATSDEAKRRADALVMGARQRLSLWDISGWQLRQIAKRKKPMKYISVAAPASGFVVEKNVVAGASVKTGQRLFRIAGLDRVWVEADVYENDLPYIKPGQEATITLTHVPGRTFKGKVAFIYPYLDKHARTTRVRVELKNKDKALKPDMYANVGFTIQLGTKLAVPEAAVIYSGPRRIVFVDIGGDRLRPKLIEVGAKAGGFFEVLSGLEPGDKVVISGNFLLSAESRLKAATGLW